MDRIARRSAVAILLAALSVSTGCGDLEPSDPKIDAVPVASPSGVKKLPHGRLLLIGIDGAAPSVMQKLMDEGRLPHLSKLASQGIWGPVRSMIPLESPRIWTTIATGKFPNKHRIRSFGYRDQEGKIRLYLSSDRPVHAIWNMTSDAGLSTSVINWWTTYPPERIDGVMVSDHAIPEEFRYRLQTFAAVDRSNAAPLIFPASWAKRLKPILLSPKSAIQGLDPFSESDSFSDFIDTGELETIYQVDNKTARIAFEVARVERPDVYFVYLKGIDRVSHHLWGMLEPPDFYPKHLRPSESERKAGAEAIYRYYVYTDAVIGKLIAGYGADDLVMVVSDHGFQADVMRDSLTGGHHDQKALFGVLFARGPGIAVGQTPGPGAKLKDITPTLLTWLGLPTALDMDGEKAAYLDRDPPPRIATYDRSPVVRIGEVEKDSGKEILDELRSLGYIE